MVCAYVIKEVVAACCHDVAIGLQFGVPVIHPLTAVVCGIEYISSIIIGDGC